MEIPALFCQQEMKDLDEKKKGKKRKGRNDDEDDDGDAETSLGVRKRIKKVKR